MSELQPFLDRLIPLLGPPDGEPRPLEGGITNRNYRATFAGREHVIRLPGRDTELLGIDRAAEGRRRAAAAELGIAPPVTRDPGGPAAAWCASSSRAARSPRRTCASPACWRPLARALARLHDAGSGTRVAFSPFRVVEDYEATARAARRLDPGRLRARARARASGSRRRWATRAEHDPVLCHNDLLAGNLLVHDGDIWIVDWEYAGMRRPLVRPGQPGREQRSGSGRGGSPAGGLLRSARRRPAARHAGA